MDKDKENPFKPKSLKKRLKEASKAQSLAGASNAIFGPTADEYSEWFSPLRKELNKANIDVLFRTYVSELMFFTTLSFFTTYGPTFILTNFLFKEMFLPLKVVLIVFLPPVVAMITFILIYYYPKLVIKQREKSINQNLPFALNHMSSVASSGAPPSSMFKLLTNFDEYGEIAVEARKVVKRIEVFGESVTASIKKVSKSTPSRRFKEILTGMISVINSGGNMEEFIKEKAKGELFEYRMKKKKQIENLSALASLYTTILVAAPLFMVIILTVLSMLGGRFMGFQLNQIMWTGVYLGIPTLNLIFIGVLELTQSND